jgi:hypothetical protein
MEQFGFENESELENVEVSLLEIKKEFASYRADYEKTSEKVRLMLANRQLGFSSCDGEMQEQRLRDVLQDYSGLRLEIAWCLTRIQTLVAKMSNIEQQVSGEIEILVGEVLRESTLQNLSRR